jgi:hypothetical protein
LPHGFTDVIRWGRASVRRPAAALLQYPVRHLKGRGRVLWPFFPLGLAKRDVAAYLRQFLDKVETGDQARIRDRLA